MASIAHTQELTQLNTEETAENTENHEEYISIKLADFQELLDENKILREYSAGRLELEERNAQLEGVIEEQAEEIKILRLEAEDTRERNRRSEQQNDLLMDSLSRVDEILSIPNKNMGASEKLAFIVVDRETGGTVDNEGSKFVDVNVGEIAKRIGMGRGTVGDNIQKLAMRGYIERNTEKEHLGGGKCLTHVQVARTLFTDRPGQLQVEKELQNDHGGERVNCEKCGGENVNIYQAYECRDCGHVSQAKLVKKQTGWRKKLTKVNLLLVEGSVEKEANQGKEGREENSIVGQLDPRGIEQPELGMVNLLLLEDCQGEEVTG